MMNKSSLITVLWKMHSDEVIDSGLLVVYLLHYGLHLEQATVHEIEVSEIETPETVYKITSYELLNNQES